MTTRTLLAPTMAVACLLAAGCGSKKKLIPVEGVVTLDGKPLAGATVQFVAEKGESPPASGLTGDDGTFKLTTFNTGDGARAGEYKVIVTFKEAADISGGPPRMDDPVAVSKAMAEFAKTQKKGPAAPKKSPVHANYSDVAKTPLRAQVPVDGKIEIKLNDKGS